MGLSVLIVFGAQIWGVGPKKAISLIKSGIKSVAALRQEVARQEREGGPPVLSSQQLVGLRCYHDLQQRIPRCVGLHHNVIVSVWLTGAGRLRAVVTRVRQV